MMRVDRREMLLAFGIMFASAILWGWLGALMDFRKSGSLIFLAGGSFIYFTIWIRVARIQIQSVIIAYSAVIIATTILIWLNPKEMAWDNQAKIALTSSILLLSLISLFLPAIASFGAWKLFRYKFPPKS